MLYPLSYGRVRGYKLSVYHRFTAKLLVCVVIYRKVDHRLYYNRITTRAHFIDPSHTFPQPAMLYVEIR